MATRHDSSELLQGTLAILILKALLAGSTHGYGIARWVETTTDDVLKIEEGSLYPALQRLERKGWIQAEWGLSETKRRVKFYRLTDAGRARLVVETEQWGRFAETVARILHAPAEYPA